MDNPRIEDEYFMWPSDTPRRRLLKRLVFELEHVEIQRELDIGRDCPDCGKPLKGFFDEECLRGKPVPLSMKGAGLYPYYFGKKMNRVTIRYGDGFTQSAQGNLTDYEIVQSIILTGLYNREQLGLSKLTQHELEVCERRFAEVRPPYCGCHVVDTWVPTDEDLEFYLQWDLPENEYVEKYPVEGLTAVEQSLVDGKGVRTGFRRRSPDAKRRRRLQWRSKRRASYNSRIVEPKPLEGFPMQDVNPAKIELKFNFIPFGRNSRQYKRTAKEIRSIRSEVKVQKSVHKTVHYRLDRNLVVRPKIDPRPPKPNQAKYWYFRRKRGYYYHSLHHPLDGDIVPMGTRRDYSEPSG